MRRLGLALLLGCAGCMVPARHPDPGPRGVPWQRIMRDEADAPPRYIEVQLHPRCPFWAGGLSTTAANIVCQPVYSVVPVAPETCMLAMPPIIRITKDKVEIIDQEALCKGS